MSGGMDRDKLLERADEIFPRLYRSIREATEDLVDAEMSLVQVQSEIGRMRLDDVIWDPAVFKRLQEHWQAAIDDVFKARDEVIAAAKRYRLIAAQPEKP